MKVAYLALGETYGSPHAGFIHTYNIVKSLSKLIDIKLFISGRSKETEIPVTFVSLPSFRSKNPIKNISSYKRMKREMKVFEIVHERFHVNPVDLLFLKGKKYILEVNDPSPVIYSGVRAKIYSKIIKRKFDRADVIVTQTQTMKKILSEFYKGKIHIIPNGVDFNFFEENKNNFDIRKRYSIKKDNRIITFVGAFREWHGVQDIPEIAKEIEKKHKVTFLLVGTGQLFKEISCKKTENMILTGPLKGDEIPSVLSQSDVLIAPFNTKRFKSLEKYGFYWCPVKIFEYMASGTPLVSYDFNEIRNITKDSAILCEKGKLNEFVDGIARLIKDPELSKKLGENAKKAAKKHHDWDRRAEETIKIYKEIL